MSEVDLRCYHHPEREAVNQCDRCGDYLCGECWLWFRGEHVCHTCHKDLSRATLGKTGRIACVIVFASFAVSWATWRVIPLLTPVQLSWPTPFYCLSAIYVLSAPAALVLSLMGRNAEQYAARKLRAAIALYSALGVAQQVVPCVHMAVIRMFGSGIPNLMLSTLITSCLFLAGSTLATVLLSQALRCGIKPLWSVILLAVPVLFTVAQSPFIIYRIASRLPSVVAP